MPMDRNTGARIDVFSHISQCVRNVIQTPTNTRPMNLDYGANLIDLVDVAMNPEGRSKIAAATAGAATEFETRPTMERVTTSAAESGALSVSLYWKYEGEDAETTTEI